MTLEKPYKIALLAVLALALVLSPFILRGCNSTADDGLSKENREMANRLEQIVAKSNGDWEKLSAEDKQYLIKDVSGGSEESARMLLLAKSGKLKGAPPTPPGGK